MAESSLEANKSDVQKTLKPGNVLPLVRGDSGYISPLSPETPISEHSTPSRTSFLPLDSGGSGASVRSSVASYSSGNSTSADSMAAVQRDSGRMRLVRQASTPVLEWERTPGDVSQQVLLATCFYFVLSRLGGMGNIIDGVQLYNECQFTASSYIC